MPLPSGLGHLFSKRNFPLKKPKKPPHPLGTPPKEGNVYNFPSFGGVPERRGGFSKFE
jgi:hypothetical protein